MSLAAMRCVLVISVNLLRDCTRFRVPFFSFSQRASSNKQPVFVSFDVHLGKQCAMFAFTSYFYFISLAINFLKTKLHLHFKSKLGKFDPVRDVFTRRKVVFFLICQINNNFPNKSATIQYQNCRIGRMTHRW